MEELSGGRVTHSGNVIGGVRIDVGDDQFYSIVSRLYKLEQEVVELARQFVSEHPEIAALLLQCSDLPPYAWAIQKELKLPVFDMTTLINWLYNAVVRRPFRGII